jgi:hypothetical protein
VILCENACVFIREMLGQSNPHLVTTDNLYYLPLYLYHCIYSCMAAIAITITQHAHHAIRMEERQNLQQCKAIEEANLRSHCIQLLIACSDVHGPASSCGPSARLDNGFGQA